MRLFVSTPLVDCHLVVVRGLVCLRDPKTCWFRGRGQTKSSPTLPYIIYRVSYIRISLLDFTEIEDKRMVHRAC